LLAKSAALRGRIGADDHQWPYNVEILGTKY
jgi:hypothetical protein